MISSFNLRINRWVCIGFFITNIIIIIGLVDYTYSISTIEYSQIKGFENYFQKVYGINDQNNTIDTFSKFGYQIEPQDVKFKFINQKNKQGTPKEILAGNKEVYKKVLEQNINEPKDFDVSKIRPPKPEEIDNYERASAVIVALVRNSEILKISKTIRQFEKSFNEKFKYPYMFINDEPFDERFKKRMEKLLPNVEKEFVTIPPELWDKPNFINVEYEKEEMQKFADKNIAYALKASYHNMCRFYLGNFYKLPEMAKYRYYWRIEPDVHFYNDVNYDVFKYLENTGKVYGFTINLYDIHETVRTLWPETLKFLNTDNNYKYVNENGAFQWLLENQQNPKKNKDTEGYSTCHFWSNFEIGDTEFFKGEAYSEWFKFLDSTGKFYYERWGDAPIHSLGLALFTDKSKIHWFRDIGYFHDPYVNCPNSPSTKKCKIAEFSRWDHLSDQNCMASWIDYSMDDPSLIY